MHIEFYNVKKKSKVKIPSEEVQASKLEKTNKDGSTRVRYVLKAIDSDGTKLNKFCNKETFEQLN
jgi:hypothetical protein